MKKPKLRLQAPAISSSSRISAVHAAINPDCSNWNREPTIAEIMSDSGVRAMMNADGVDPNGLEAMLRRIARLCNRRSPVEPAQMDWAQHWEIERVEVDGQRVSDMIGDATSSCQIVSAGPEFVGKHGYLCAPGISKQSVGARGINLQIAIIPPGAWTKAHKHNGHETAIHILSGEAGIWHGERLDQHLIARAGDFLYIPPDIPHQPYNLSDIATCVAIVAQTDPNDQESVVLLPELERAGHSCCDSK